MFNKVKTVLKYIYFAVIGLWFLYWWTFGIFSPGVWG